MKSKSLATITVIGQDRTGVIARITNFLFEHGANIEALDEQVTRGQFSMVLQASWSGSHRRPPTLQAMLNQLARELKMEIKVRMPSPQSQQKFALMVTKETHCLDLILKQVKTGTLKADPAVILSNYNDLQPKARAARIPYHTIPWHDRSKAEDQAIDLLDHYQVDFVVLARFMKILSPNFVWRYKNKIINIHPSLLPSFPGPQAYRQAYERGVKIAGVTAHFVTMHLDEGPIIAQGSFPVRPSMTLPQIVAAGQKQEAKVLARAIQLFLKKRLDVHWGVVKEV